MKEFFEEYSLFKKFTTSIPEYVNHLKIPSINMFCQTCKSVQTFGEHNKYHTHGTNHTNVYLSNLDMSIVFICQSCKRTFRQFQIHFNSDRTYCYKFGQYPEWEIKIDKNLEETLGDHAPLYRKGLVCESQGYGIAAFAYYRRITEDIIDELLDSISELIAPEDKEKYQVALEKTKTTRVTQEKIDLVKDLLPSTLRPSGYNPLGVLHSELSEGLHAESDQACLEVAGHVKSILTFLINQIIHTREANKEFTASMKTLLAKKGGGK
jgi:hypothetical protein